MTNEDMHIARKLSNYFSYIDDPLVFKNYTLMNKNEHDMYPKELVLKKENTFSNKSTLLDT